MDIRELVNIYLKSRRLVVKSGNEGDFSPLLPLIIMDSAYQMWQKYIRPVECRHEMKKLKNEWSATYHAFNRDYFRCYNAEQVDFLCDLMDANEEYLRNDIMVAFVQCSNLCKGETFEREQVLAACMMMDIFTSLAILIWQRCYRNGYPKDKDNIYLTKLSRNINRWKNLYYGGEDTVNPNDSEEIVTAVDILTRKQIKFLQSYYV